jgi:hypothetical protein
MFRQHSPERLVEPLSADNLRQAQNASKERNTRLISNGTNNNSWSQQQLTPQNTSQPNNSYSNRQIINSSNQIVTSNQLTQQTSDTSNQGINQRTLSTNQVFSQPPPPIIKS